VRSKLVRKKLKELSFFKNVSPFPFDIAAKGRGMYKVTNHINIKVPCLIVSKFLYLSFEAIIRETDRLCCKLKAILYPV
jgi:hypothetical protein